MYQQDSHKEELHLLQRENILGFRDHVSDYAAQQMEVKFTF
jgi:hypothetical protein